MSIRRRDDSVKPGCGIDGTEGESFTRQRTDPWDSNPKGNRVPYGAGKYTDNESGLRNKLPSDPTGGAVSRDIFDDVEGQSSDSGNRAVRSRGQP
jgi:hypothetical protein